MSIALVFTIVLSTLSTFIGSLDFSRQMEAYEEDVRGLQQHLSDVTVYGQLDHRIILPPQPLAILARGVVGVASQQYDVGFNYYSRSAGTGGGSSYDSQYMKTLVQIDFVTVVALLLSFLAVVLGFDGISGERERGTLKQLLTNPVPRAHVVLAKLIGGLISLWVPFAVAFIICLLLMLANADVILSGEDWVRLGLLFALTCLFLAQVYAFSLMVSALVRNTDTSLIVCLFAWLVFGVGAISALPSAARYGTQERPHANYETRDRDLWDQLTQTLEEWEAANPPPAQAYFQGIQRDGRVRYQHPASYEYLQRRYAFELDKRLERADASYQAVFHTWDPLAQEAFSVDRWSLLSPFMNYQVLAYQLARTTLDDQMHVGQYGRDYRRTYIQYLRGKGAFSSRRWFTDDPVDQQPLFPDPTSATEEMLAPDSPYMLERMAWAEQQERLAADDDRRRLDLSDLPRPSPDWQRSLGDSVATMAPGLIVVILGFVLAVLVTTTRFLRYDPR